MPREAAPVRKTTLAEIRACAREGLSLRAAALRLGVPYPTLRLRAWRLGVSFERQNARLRSPSRDKIVAAMRDGAETAPQIAASTGIIQSTVSVILQQAEDRGIVQRARGSHANRNGRPPIRWCLPDAEARP